MPSTIGKCKLFRLKHTTLLEGETFLRNKHEISFFEIKCKFFGRKENTICFSLLSTLFMCAIVSYLYNSNYNNNYSFVILICSQPFLQAILVSYSSPTTIRSSAHNLFVSTNTYSLGMYSEELQTTNVFFTCNTSSHKTDWIATDFCLLCLAFLYPHVFCLMKVLAVARLGFCLLEISFVLFWLRILSTDIMYLLTLNNK